MEDRIRAWTYLLAFIAFASVGLVFHTTKYYEVTQNEVKKEITKEEFYKEMKIVVNIEGVSFEAEYSFNFQYAIIISVLILGYGFFFRKVMGKKFKR